MKNKKYFVSIEERIKILKSRNLLFDDLKLFKWYLTKYNYQSFVNGYNDFFLINKNREVNRYKKDAISSDIIKLFNFDRHISSLILGDIQNVERLLQNAIVNTIYEIYKKLVNYQNVNNQDLDFLHKGTILKLSDKTWYTIFERDKKLKLLKNKIILKLKNIKDKKLIEKYNENYCEIPIWSFILLLDFGTVIDIANSFSIRCFDIAMSFLNFGLKNKIHINTYEFDAIFKNFKSVRNLICHSNVLYNYCNDKSLRRINDFFERNKLDKVNSVRLFDVIILCNLFAQISGKKYSSYTYIENRIKRVIKQFKSKNIIGEIVDYMHTKKYFKKL